MKWFIIVGITGYVAVRHGKVLVFWPMFIVIKNVDSGVCCFCV